MFHCVITTPVEVLTAPSCRYQSASNGMEWVLQPQKSTLPSITSDVHTRRNEARWLVTVPYHHTNYHSLIKTPSTPSPWLERLMMRFERTRSTIRVLAAQINDPASTYTGLIWTSPRGDLNHATAFFNEFLATALFALIVLALAGPRGLSPSPHLSLRTQKPAQTTCTSHNMSGGK